MSDCHSDRQHYGKGMCRPCYAVVWRESHQTHIAAKKRAYYAADPQRYIANTRKSLYGITREQHRDLTIGQAGRCLICGQVPRRGLVVDHDHKTKKIRGLLCHECNRGLGFLRDDLTLLRSAVRYLETAP